MSFSYIIYLKIWSTFSETEKEIACIIFASLTINSTKLVTYFKYKGKFHNIFQVFVYTINTYMFETLIQNSDIYRAAFKHSYKVMVAFTLPFMSGRAHHTLSHILPILSLSSYHTDLYFRGSGPQAIWWWRDKLLSW